ncbi:MAG: hypothetical protein GX168_07020 [Bacteroidales bacterium]|jgi:hypothetical protein|nr:hypothetical protein [Bacteroidales bacterium]
MKKKILALAFVAAMTLGLAKTVSSEPGTFTCVGFTAYCGYSTIACGSTIEEMLAHGSIMSHYVCTVVAAQDQEEDLPDWLP